MPSQRERVSQMYDFPEVHSPASVWAGPLGSCGEYVTGGWALPTRDAEVGYGLGEAQGNAGAVCPAARAQAAPAARRGPYVTHLRLARGTPLRARAPASRGRMRSAHLAWAPVTPQPPGEAPALLRRPHGFGTARCRRLRSPRHIRGRSLLQPPPWTAPPPRPSPESPKGRGP